MSYTLNLTASSPLLSYSPNIASSSSSSSWSGWLGSSTQSQTGGSPDTVQYATYGDTSWIGLSNIVATAFTPYFSTSVSDYEVLYQIDSGQANAISLASSGTSISLPSTSSSTHDVTIQVKCKASAGCSPSSPFIFSGLAISTLLVPNGQSPNEATLDDSSNIISYTGFYTTQGNGSADSTALVPTNIVSQSVDGTLSYTATSNATASLYFTGTSILLTGISGPSIGGYNVSVDGVIIGNYNGSSTVFSARDTLAFVTGLKPGEHLFQVQNDAGGGGLAIDGFVAYGGTGGSCFGQGCTPATAATPYISISLGITASYISSAAAAATSTATSAPATPGLEKSGPSAATIVGAIIGVLAAIALFIAVWRYKVHRDQEVKKPVVSVWDNANLLSRQDNQYVEVIPESEGQQGYTTPYQTAHSRFD